MFLIRWIPVCCFELLDCRGVSWSFRSPSCQPENSSVLLPPNVTTSEIIRLKTWLLGTNNFQFKHIIKG